MRPLTWLAARTRAWSISEDCSRAKVLLGDGEKPVEGGLQRRQSRLSAAAETPVHLGESRRGRVAVVDEDGGCGARHAAVQEGLVDPGRVDGHGGRDGLPHRGERLFGHAVGAARPVDGQIASHVQTRRQHDEYRQYRVPTPDTSHHGHPLPPHALRYAPVSAGRSQFMSTAFPAGRGRPTAGLGLVARGCHNRRKRQCSGRDDERQPPAARRRDPRAGVARPATGRAGRAALRLPGRRAGRVPVRGVAHRGPAARRGGGPRAGPAGNGARSSDQRAGQRSRHPRSGRARPQRRHTLRRRAPDGRRRRPSARDRPRPRAARARRPGVRR